MVMIDLYWLKKKGAPDRCARKDTRLLFVILKINCKQEKSATIRQK